MRTQLERYGTNIAKWGFNVCALHDFNDLRHGKNGKKSAFNNFRVQLHGKLRPTAYSGPIGGAFESLGLPRRNWFDLLVKIAVVLACNRMCSSDFLDDIVCSHLSHVSDDCAIEA